MIDLIWLKASEQHISVRAIIAIHDLVLYFFLICLHINEICWNCSLDFVKSEVITVFVAALLITAGWFFSLLPVGFFSFTYWDITDPFLLCSAQSFVIHFIYFVTTNPSLQLVWVFINLAEPLTKWYAIVVPMIRWC